MVVRDAKSGSFGRAKLLAGALGFAALAVLVAPSAMAQSVDDFADRAWTDYFVNYPACQDVIRRQWAADDMIIMTNEQRRLSRSQAEKDALDRQREYLVLMRDDINEMIKDCARRQEELAREATQRAEDVAARTETPAGQVARVARQPASAPATGQTYPPDQPKPLLTPSQIVERARWSQAQARAKGWQETYGKVVDILYRGGGGLLERLQGL